MAIALATGANGYFHTMEDSKTFRACFNVVVSTGYTTGGESLATILANNRFKVGAAAAQRGTPISAYATGNQGNQWAISQVPATSPMTLQLWTSTPGTEFTQGAYNTAQTADVIRIDICWQKGGSSPSLGY